MRTPNAASLLAAAHQMALLPPMRTATCPSNFETGLKVRVFFQLFLEVIQTACSWDGWHWELHFASLQHKVVI